MSSVPLIVSVGGWSVGNGGSKNTRGREKNILYEERRHHHSLVRSIGEANNRT